MIDVGWAAANGLWILGLAWVAAALSWRAGGSAGGPSARVGLLVAGLGLCAAREFLPERVLWALVALAVLLQPAVTRRRHDES